MRRAPRGGLQRRMRGHSACAGQWAALPCGLRCRGVWGGTARALGVAAGPGVAQPQGPLRKPRRLRRRRRRQRHGHAAAASHGGVSGAAAVAAFAGRRQGRCGAACCSARRGAALHQAAARGERTGAAFVSVADCNGATRRRFCCAAGWCDGASFCRCPAALPTCWDTRRRGVAELRRALLAEAHPPLGGEGAASASPPLRTWTQHRILAARWCVMCAPKRLTCTPLLNHARDCLELDRRFRSTRIALCILPHGRVYWRRCPPPTPTPVARRLPVRHAHPTQATGKPLTPCLARTALPLLAQRAALRLRACRRARGACCRWLRCVDKTAALRQRQRSTATTDLACTALPLQRAARSRLHQAAACGERTGPAFVSVARACSAQLPRRLMLFTAAAQASALAAQAAACAADALAATAVLAAHAPAARSCRGCHPRRVLYLQTDAARTLMTGAAHPQVLRHGCGRAARLAPDMSRRVGGRPGARRTSTRRVICCPQLGRRWKVQATQR